MRLALDFDGTYTADPEFWKKFIVLANEHGHEVVCVSSRFPGNPPTGVPAEIVCCSFTAKCGVTQADIWIDDNPWSIHLDYPRDPNGQLLAIELKQPLGQLTIG